MSEPIRIAAPGNARVTVQTNGWTRHDYEHGETIWQRRCPDCDGGLLMSPGRFCPRCDGSGFETSTMEPTL